MPGAPSSLVSWWRFEEAAGDTLLDSKGSNHGTKFNTARIAGQVGNALDFAGVNTSYGDLTNGTGLEPNLISVECLLRIPFTAGNKLIFIKPYSVNWAAPVLSVAIVYLQGGNTLNPQININGAGISGITTVVPDSNWHHWVFTYDGDKIRLYLDSVQSAISASLGGAGTIDYGTNQKWTLAVRHQADPGEPFDGDIDECAIYNQPIGLAQVQSNYTEANAGRPYFGLGSTEILLMNSNSRGGL